MPENLPKSALLGALAVVVVAALLITQAVTGGDAPDAGVGPETPTGRTVSIAPAPTQAPSPNPSDGASPSAGKNQSGDRAAAAKVASDAIVAYTEFSWTDPHEAAWLDRLEPHITGSFRHELEEMFTDDGAYWKREVVANQQQTRTTVTDVAVSGMHKTDNTKRKITFDVTFETSIKTMHMDDWGEATPLSMWVTVVKQGRNWKVSLVRQAGEGG